jgi:hypothetical protein
MASVASLPAAYTILAAGKPAPRNSAALSTKPAKPSYLAPNGYCWTHGYRVRIGHDSATCKDKGDGHKDKATRANTMWEATTIKVGTLDIVGQRSHQRIIMILINLVTLMLLQLPLSPVAPLCHPHLTPLPLLTRAQAITILLPAHRSCASIVPPRRQQFARQQAKPKPLPPWRALLYQSTYSWLRAPDTSYPASPTTSSAWVNSTTTAAPHHSTSIT